MRVRKFSDIRAATLKFVIANIQMQASERSLPRLSRDCCFSVAASGSVLKLMQFYL